MKISESDLIREFRDKLKNGLIETRIQGKQRVYMKVTKESCKLVVDFLRKKFNARLITVNALEADSIVEIIYHFDIQGLVLSLKIATSKLTPQLCTISDIIPSAGYYEKEVAESFGLIFLNANNRQNNCRTV